MAKVSARHARILLGGRNVSCRSNSVTLTMSAEAPEATTFCDENRVRLSSGIKDVEMSIDGFFDDAASSVDQAYYSWVGASILAGFYPVGLSACVVGREFNGILSNYEMSFATEDAAVVNITVTGCTPLLTSKILGYAGVLSGAGTSNLSSVDFTNGTNASQYAIFRLMSLTGTSPEFSASVQLSPDDSAWTTVAAVEGASPPSAGSPTGASIVYFSSASRYRRVAVTLGGTSPSANYFVACASLINLA